MNLQDQDTILAKVTDVMRNLFDEYDGPITMETNADDIEQWDSLSHVRLMITIEMELGIRFDTAELQGFKNLGDLVAAAAREAG
jgi:acyl carrier protein